MKMYMVGNRDTIEDSQWRVAAESPDQAVEIYLKAMLEEEISVDADEFEELGKIEVQAENASLPREPGIIQWECGELFSIQLDEIDAWNEARGVGVEP
ncbi:hypothetical protein KUV57_11165 [Epibacterium sp. DP7N7-1]|nr:hypothetical protein [Epibacterium sp. DP7N7-1]